MDRARDPGAARPWRPPRPAGVRRDRFARARREDWQPLIRRFALLALAAGGAGGAALACKINTDLNLAVAIEIVLPDSARVEVTDTFRPSARALNGLGDSVQAQLFWSSLDTTLQVLDSTTGVSLARLVGTARLQARTGKLFSNTQTVQVLARLDSMAAAVHMRDTLDVTPTDSTVDSLSNQLTIATVGFRVAAATRRVAYPATTYPH